MIILKKQSRRNVLRGMMGGAAVTVGLPFLDTFLNNNGTALAATGQALPVCFGTWVWGCGLNPGRWEPAVIGKYDTMAPELKPLEAHKRKINVFSGMRVPLDGAPNESHWTGHRAVLTGVVPRGGRSNFSTAPSIDQSIADVIGGKSRFRSIEVACTGKTSDTMSFRGPTVTNSSEVSPAALYTRIFGPEFHDPNAADFKPDPKMLARKSVLTAVEDERRAFMKTLGASDKARLDEYFTSLRELEQQIDLSLAKPTPLEACSTPPSPEELTKNLQVDNIHANHKLFARLLAHALACGQTRVVNINFTDYNSSIRKPGESATHHVYTHEESVDAKLGYQKNVGWFINEIMTGFNTLLTTMDSVREGDGTLLDRMLVFASTDTGYAKLHSAENMPMITAGGAGGRIKTGMHVQANGDSVTRVGLTLQQAMGVPIGHWGVGAALTSKTITEVMA